MALSELKQIPIADLHPGIPVTESAVHGIVTLVWPYSSVTSTFSFLLVEPDFRLRRHRGQVRISLRGSCARRVTRAGLVSGDEVRLAVEGVQWRKDPIVASTPGRGIEWELVYEDHLRLERILEDGSTQLIDTSRMGASPERQPSDLSPTSNPLSPHLLENAGETPQKEARKSETTNTWSSPIFLKNRRLPDIFPLRSDLDPFPNDSDDWESGNPAKKVKFGRKSDQWRFVERSPSPKKQDEIVVEEEASSDTTRNGTKAPSSISAKSEYSLSAFSDATVAREDPHNQSVQNRAAPSFSAPSIRHMQPENQKPSPFRNVSNLEIDLSAHEQSVGSSHSAEISYPALHAISDEVLELPTVISEQLVEDVESNPLAVNQPLPETDHQHINLPTFNRDISRLSPARRRSRSRTPESALQIQIQGATPLMQPTTTDLRPLTPRLQPLPSPGLTVVSPIDQRQQSRSEYFIQAYMAREAEASQPRDQPVKSSNDTIIIPDAQVDPSQIHRPVDTGMSYLSTSMHSSSSFGEDQDTLLDQLPARYDQGVVQEAGSSLNQSHIPETNLSTTARQGDASTVEEMFPEQEESVEESIEEDSSKPGNLRNINDGPIYEEKNAADIQAESPLLTDHLESGHSVSEQTASTQSQLTDAPLPRVSNIIRDTYFVNDELDRTESSLIRKENKAEVEVVELLDSDSASETGVIAKPASSAENPNLTQGLSDAQAQEKVIEESSPITKVLSVTEADAYQSQDTKHPSQSNEEDTNANLSSKSASSQQDLEQGTRSSKRKTRSQSQQQPDVAETSQDSEAISRQLNEDLISIQTDSQEMTGGFRTAHEYYSTLPTLHEYFNNNTSVLAVVVASSKPIRSTAGPRDYNQTLYLSSPHSKEDNDFTVAQLFRPYNSAFPYPIPSGAVILLKDFKVQSYQRKMSLLSTETSAWAVFDLESASSQSDMKVSNPGPPVEFGATERGVAWDLGKWWNTLDKDLKAKIERVSTAARNKAEAELEKKAAAEGRKKKPKGKASSQSLSTQQTPARRQTRSSQSQGPQSSVPSTPIASSPTQQRTQSSQAEESPPTTPSPTHRRTRSSQQAQAQPISPTSPSTSVRLGTKRRKNSRSSPIIPASQPETEQSVGAEHELRSGLVYSDNESDLAEIPSRSLVDEPVVPSASTSKRGAAAATRRTTRSKAKEDNNDNKPAASQGKAKKGKGKTGADAGPVWHELRDGASYKD